MWNSETNNQWYMTETVFQGTLKKIESITSVNWDEVCFDDSIHSDNKTPYEVRIFVNTNIGELMFVCPHPWRMKKEDLQIEGKYCALFLNRLREVLGLSPEVFIDPVEHPLESNNQLVRVVNELRNIVNTDT